MSARHKLNKAALNGVLLIGTALAVLSGFWIELPIAIVAGVIMAIANGDIRLNGRNGRR